MLNLKKNPFFNLPDSLRRVTSGAAFIPEIDGLRFLAIFPVILQHFSERISRKGPHPEGFDLQIVRVLANGHIGVYIFFFISGFILALPFGKQKLLNGKPVSISKYYLRRLTRLEPPYLLCMTLFFLLLVKVYHESFSELFPHFIASCLYLHRLVYGVWSPINPLAWTLEIEVQFYLIAPFLALFYFSCEKVKRRLVLIGFIVLKIVLFCTTKFLDKFFLTLPSVVEFFILGILLADIYLTEWKNGISKHRVYDLVAIVSIVVMFSSWTWGKNLPLKLVFIASLFFAVFGTFKSLSVNTFFRNKWVTAIGGMCYTIYLFHLGLAEFFVGKFYNLFAITPYFLLNYVIGLIVFLPFLFVVCTILFLAVEKPCMDPQWASKLWARVRGVKRAVRS